MNIYLWAKLLHLFFLMGWMTTVFGLPVLLLTLADPETDPVARGRFMLLGRRLYRLGHHLFGWAFVFGMVLWLHVGIGGGWLHVKLGIVALLLAHFTVSGRLLKKAAHGHSLPSAHLLWWHCRLPVVLLLAILWLVLAKPL